ncbi:steroid Delta-isomerase [Pseudomonas fontis]|uniref:Nuclear transport factor 2 family protein n=1 Tax=Pseudomonas fontis TaxID=2942633 RepID=A0ABT5NTD3_9PSED|nr:steroid Delta-isomerase [Pseudomonas fontis]MDD0977033.1 nuclear transport factor 2 family protein [Pseudomonas fontis]MDD0991416.1 nuclear transport factor 2 family protein [Pseudomonas fontis]
MDVFSPKNIQAAMARYVELVDAGDIDGILGMYAEDATVEDPVGNAPLKGAGEIADFYRQGLGAGKVTAVQTGPVRATHNGSGAVPFRVQMQWAGQPCALDVIDVMSFDGQGRIVSMKAYWSEVNLSVC